MKERKRRQSLGGAVLMMVLTVMFVLIILLMATLTTVSTANQRIYTKFEENQAYYTARSALDVFTQNMLDDASYESGKTYNYTDRNTTPVKVENGKIMKQGLALQLDLYKIHSQCQTYGKDTSGDSKLKWAENMDATTAADIFSKANMDPSGGLTDDPPEKDNFSISAAKLNNSPVDPNASEAEKKKQEQKQFDYIEYQVTLPSLNDGSNNYGKFVDVDKSKTGNPQIAKIKVEVLDRVYATDPSYTSDQIKMFFDSSVSAADKSAAGCPSSDDELKAAIANGSRSKDYMKLKITSSVTAWGVEGTAVVIIETTEKSSPSGDNAITSTGSIAGGSGAKVRAYGGAATMDTGTTTIGDGNDMSGSTFALGKLEWKSSAKITVNKGDYIVAMSGVARSSNPVAINATDKGAYAFWGGQSEIEKGTIGNAANDVPVIANEIVKYEASELYFNGDVYVNTFVNNASNPGKIQVAAGHNMYVKDLKLHADMFEVTEKNEMNQPTKITIKSSEWDSLRVKLCEGYSIQSVDGLIQFNNSVTGTYNGTSVTLTNTLDTTGGAAFDMNNFEAIKKSDKIYRKYTLPFNVDGNNYIEVPTAQSCFANYFKSDAFHEQTGELKNFTKQGIFDLTDPVNNYTTIYGDLNKNSWLKTGADMLAEYMKKPAQGPGDPPYTLSGLLSGQTVHSFPTSADTITLDGNDMFYTFDNNYYGHYTVKVTGSSGRLILVVPDSSKVKLENIFIVTDNIDYGAGNEIQVENGVTKAPKIDIYAGTGSEIETASNFFCAGYFMMPTAKLKILNGKPNARSYINNGISSDVDNIAIVGSVLCGELEETNQIAVLYLNKNSGGEVPGEPHLTVQSSTYIRS